MKLALSLKTITPITYAQGSYQMSIKLVLPDGQEIAAEQMMELECDFQLEEVTKMVFEFIEGHPGAKTSDLIIELAVDPKLIVEALEKLRTDDKIEGKNVQAKQ